MPQLTAKLSREAKAGWDALSREHGATVTGMVEAIGRLANRSGPVIPSTADVAAMARSIDQERRARTPRTP